MSTFIVCGETDLRCDCGHNWRKTLLFFKTARRLEMQPFPAFSSLLHHTRL